MKLQVVTTKKNKNYNTFRLFATGLIVVGTMFPVLAQSRPLSDPPASRRPFAAGGQTNGPQAGAANPSAPGAQPNPTNLAGQQNPPNQPNATGAQGGYTGGGATAMGGTPQTSMQPVMPSGGAGPGVSYDNSNAGAMQGVADTQPTLNGNNQMGNATSAAAPKPDLSQFLMSVDDPSHPIHDIVALKRPDNSTIRGKNLFVYELLSGVSSPTARKTLLQAYWGLSEKLLLCHARLAQKQRIELAMAYYKNNQGSYQNNQAILDELTLAHNLVERQSQALELEFAQEQYEFVELQKRHSSVRFANYTPAGLPGTDCACAENTSVMSASYKGERTPETLPIPNDFPLALPYDTKMKELEKSRTISAKSRLLDRTIPLQYQSLMVRADACKCADAKMIADLKAGRSVVAPIETLTNEQIELIKAVIDYNHKIDEYVIETFGSQVTEKQLLGAILHLPKQPNAATSPTTMQKESTRQSQSPQTGQSQNQAQTQPQSQPTPSTFLQTAPVESTPPAYPSVRQQ